MQLHSRPCSTSLRTGLTIVEVIVAVCVLLFLFALIAPAVLTSKSISREVRCLDNLRSLGSAVPHFQGELPLLENGNEYGNWCRQLLPRMQYAELDRAIDGGADPSAEIIPEFICPQDTTAVGQPGGLSYVANAGFISHDLWDQPDDTAHAPGHVSYNYGDPDTDAQSEQDLEIFLASGVFHRQLPRPMLPMTLDRIQEGDGQQYTLLFTENRNAQHWYSRDTGDMAIGIEIDLAEFTQAPNNTNATALSPQNYAAINKHSFINTPAPEEAEGRFPRPSSSHEGFVNVFLCDGRGTKLNNHVDSYIYITMITSNGQRYGEANTATSEE